MHDPERMLEACMPGAGPDPRDEPELLDALEPSERGRADQGDIRSTKGNPVVEGVPDGGCNRECGSWGDPWRGHDGKDRPDLDAASAATRRHVCSGTRQGTGDRGHG